MPPSRCTATDCLVLYYSDILQILKAGILKEWLKQWLKGNKCDDAALWWCVPMIHKNYSCCVLSRSMLFLPAISRRKMDMSNEEITRAINRWQAWLSQLLIYHLLLLIYHLLVPIKYASLVICGKNHENCGILPMSILYQCLKRIRLTLRTLPENCLMIYQIRHNWEAFSYHSESFLWE